MKEKTQKQIQRKSIEYNAICVESHVIIRVGEK